MTTGINNLHLQGSQMNSATNKIANSREDKELKQACNDFEAIFVKQMLDSMKKTVNKSGLIDGGMSEEIFDDMLYDNYAQSMAKTSNLGIAKQMYEQLSHTI